MHLKINESYANTIKIHERPPVYLVENFLTDEECEHFIKTAHPLMEQSLVETEHGRRVASKDRSSYTCFLDKCDVMPIVDKIERLTNATCNQMEIPQVCRYTNSQQYRYHHDGKHENTAEGREFFKRGGQRLATVLMYLNDVERGGHTHFKYLDISVKPKKGAALVFFPGYLNGKIDESALHCAMPAVDTKWVSQIWIRQREHRDGISSKQIRASENASRLLTFYRPTTFT